ncbi:MAG TPA: hypothetical protein VFC26_15425, partial [Verrucomicrobiae bacterium]|nr:hypothetical protein [Verrucomicrobiae bacterium]
PEVVQPIAFCLDDRGRVWVAEGRTYPRRRGNPPATDRGLAAIPKQSDPAAGANAVRPERPPSAGAQPTPDQLKDIFNGLDRILVFEDTDGDHKADKKTVFLEIPGIKPVNQYKFKVKITAADGSPISEDIYGTIHRLGNRKNLSLAR